MPNPTFPVDGPEPALPEAPPAAEPESSPVDHDDVHAALSDALGVPAEDVHEDADSHHPAWVAPVIPSAPPLRTVPEIMADKNHDFAKLDNQTLPRDPSVTPRKGDTFVQGMNNAGVQGILRQAAAEQEKSNAWSGEGQTPAEQPDHGSPFRERALTSQRLKRSMQLDKSAFPEIEIEGFQVAAQIIAQIMTSDPETARQLWMQLGKHCDDVAAALR